MERQSTVRLARRSGMTMSDGVNFPGLVIGPEASPGKESRPVIRPPDAISRNIYEDTVAP